MALSQSRPKSKETGGRYKDFRKKRLHELGKVPTHTRLGKTKQRKTRVMGANEKIRLLMADSANVFDKKTKRTQKVTIKAVLENPANRHYVRRNIITKGTIIDTELGKARVTSRPGKEGTVNAVLV